MNWNATGPVIGWEKVELACVNSKLSTKNLTIHNKMVAKNRTGWPIMKLRARKEGSDQIGQSWPIRSVLGLADLIPILGPDRPWSGNSAWSHSNEFQSSNWDRPRLGRDQPTRCWPDLAMIGLGSADPIDPDRFWGGHSKSYPRSFLPWLIQSKWLREIPWPLN